MSTLALTSATNPQRIPSRMIARPHSSSIYSSCRCSGAKPDACRAATEGGRDLSVHGVTFTRWMALVSATSLTTLFLVPSGEGVTAAVKQGLLAGRIPGLPEPDEQDLGDEVRIALIGPPDKVINAFAPEVIGENVEGKVMSMSVAEHSGRTYYQFELEQPHCLITATAAGIRLYLFNVVANGLQWKRHYEDLKRIADSF